MTAKTHDDEYPGYSTIEPEKGPLSATLDVIRNMVGLFAKKRKLPARAPETIHATAGYTPADRNIIHSTNRHGTHDNATAVVNIERLTRRNDVNMDDAKKNGVKFINFESDGKTITTLGLDIAGPNQSPKMVPLDAESYARLKLAAAFIANKILNEAAEIETLTRRNDVNVDEARKNGVKFIKYEADGKTITAIGIDIAGPNQSPKMVTLDAESYARLKLATAFIENKVLNEAEEAASTPVVKMNQMTA